MYNYEIDVLKNKAREGSALVLTMDRIPPEQNVFICEHKADRYSEYHSHNYYEVNYVKSGDAVNFIDDNALYMPEGSLVILHTDVFHSLFSREGSVIYNFLIRKDWLNGIALRISDSKSEVSRFMSELNSSSFPAYLFFPDVSMKTKETFNLICDCNNSPLAREGYMMVSLAELATEGSARLSAAKGTTDDSMQKMLSYISGNFNSVTLDALSNHIGYSKTHICRIFKKNLGKSFGEVVGNMRRKHAEFLLRNTSSSITEIASSIGYETVEHFSRLFKKQTGMSPSQFRRSQQQKQ